MNPSLFSQLPHPFVWTTPDDRAEVLANVNDPIWHRFLEEAEQHFDECGELRPAEFPVFCHDGDLDEVMSVAVLAYVRDDRRYWHWLADWLRGLLAYYYKIKPQWAENRARIMRGESPIVPDMTPDQLLGSRNPRQFMEGFTQGVHYWVEAGLTSVVMHLLDMLEAYAPNELVIEEKRALLRAISQYADRYAFHEEAVKYSNRGLWANAGVLLAAVAHDNSEATRLLRFQAARRHEEFRTSFLDDGFHIEGAPDYHLMAADGLLAYLLTASHLEPSDDLYVGAAGEGPFQQYPSFVNIVRAYLRTVTPGPVLWNTPRGCSVSTPVTVRPALVQAWRLTRDPEIGWFVRERMGAEALGNPTPMKVTQTALLGLGHYQPLLNFWLYRPVEAVRPPRRCLDILPDHGAVFSRSGWDSKASCVTARYGYEGTGKGHRDHAHVTVTAGGVGVLKDPFPRYGPPGLDGSPFHNTVTLDYAEPAGVLGSLQSIAKVPGADAFLIANSGGQLPDRLLLHDPREESRYWFTNSPEPEEFAFQRAILHLHGQCAILVDRVAADRVRCIDWFFHSDLSPSNDESASGVRVENYQLRRRNVSKPPQVLGMEFFGPIQNANPGEWRKLGLGGDSSGVTLGLMALDTSLLIETGHCAQDGNRTSDGLSFKGEVDYYIRARAQAATAHAVWLVQWGAAAPKIEVDREGGSLLLRLTSKTGIPQNWNVNFDTGDIALST